MRIIVVILSMILSFNIMAASRNGFNLDGALIAPSDIHAGGPPRDGIPAIDNPKYIPGHSASWLKATDTIIGVVVDGEARAFPLRILNWHEIVNTSWGDTSVVVSFCPLCGTGMVFSSEIKGEDLKFGVSGLLYQSDVLLYDRQTDSLWSQLMSQAVSGPLKGTRLKLMNSRHTSFGKWLERYPDTLVLDLKTGFRRDYSRDPYKGYAKSNNVMFPVNNDFPRQYHPKDEVLGIELQDQFLAIPYRELSKSQKQAIPYTWQNRKWTIQWRPEIPEAWIEDEKGQQYPSVRSFIFAWYGFHPETKLYEN